MEWSLDQGQLELRPTFDIRSPNAGLFDWHISVGGINFNNEHSFLDNAGYGILFKPPRNSEEDTMDTMQFMAIYGPH